MATVLALVILGWLVAFALAAQVGFDNEPATEAPSIATADATQPQAPAYGDTISAA